MTPQEKLRQAATLIEEATAVLPDEHTHCKCCDRPVYANWSAKQARDAMGLLPEKLRRIAGGTAFQKRMERVA